MKHTEKTLDELKRLPLWRIVKSRVPALSRDGQEYICSCPLGTHEDKTPSFKIYQKDQIWLAHCFSCGKSLNVFQFVEFMAISQPSVEWGIAENHCKLDKFSGDATHVSVIVPRGCRFIGHTHDDFGSPYPSPKDIEESIRMQTPDLVVSRNKAYLVNADGMVVRVQ